MEGLSRIRLEVAHLSSSLPRKRGSGASGKAFALGSRFRGNDIVCMSGDASSCLRAHIDIAELEQGAGLYTMEEARAVSEAWHRRFRRRKFSDSAAMIREDRRR